MYGQERGLPSCTALEDFAHETCNVHGIPTYQPGRLGPKTLQERRRHAHQHKNWKHFSKHKPLQEVQMRGSIEEGRHEMSLGFMENIGDCEEKVGVLF